MKPRLDQPVMLSRQVPEAAEQFVPPWPSPRIPLTSAVRLTADQDGFPEALPCSSVVALPWLAKSAEARIAAVPLVTKPLAL
jgi:hypothetical protein